MAATLTQERFSGQDWVFERKLDGIRMLAFKRRQRRAAALAQPAAPERRLSIDRSKPSRRCPWRRRSWTARRQACGVSREQPSTTSSTSSGWMVAMSHALPLSERHELLAALADEEPLQRVPWLDDGSPWQRACDEGWEGVIAKRRDALYEHRRSPYWLKMKCEASQELVVGGFTDPQGARVGLGALLVGYFRGRRLRLRGQGGHRLRYQAAAATTRAPRCARSAGTALHQGRLACRDCAHWVRPEFVVQVGFIEWTVNGKLRHPRLLGIRNDKAAAEVVRES